MKRSAAQSRHQLNLPLHAAGGGGIPDATQTELILTLMELLIAAVHPPTPPCPAGGADAREADR
jgi:hypothetical protein